MLLYKERCVCVCFRREEEGAKQQYKISHQKRLIKRGGGTEKLDISIRKFKNIESPKIISKRLKNHYLRIFSFFNFLTRKPLFWGKKIKKITPTK